MNGSILSLLMTFNTTVVHVFSGLLSSLTPATLSTGGGSHPQNVVVHPSGNYAYVMVPATNLIYQYSRNPVTGNLTPLSPASVTIGVSPQDMVISPDGLYAFVTSASAGITECSITSGALTSTGTVTLAAATNFIKMSPDGSHVYVPIPSTNNVAQYSRSAGVLTFLSNVATGNSPQAIEIHPNGNFAYVTNQMDNTISKYSISGGLLTFVSNTSTGVNPNDIVITPNGNYIYTGNIGDFTISQYSVNPISGVLTPLIPATVSVGPCYYLAISPESKDLYTTDNSSYIYQYDITAGVLTPLSPPTITTVIAGSPFGITVSPDGSSVYAANYNNGSVSQLQRN